MQPFSAQKQIVTWSPLDDHKYFRPSNRTDSNIHQSNSHGGFCSSLVVRQDHVVRPYVGVMLTDSFQDMMWHYIYCCTTIYKYLIDGRLLNLYPNQQGFQMVPHCHIR